MSTRYSLIWPSVLIPEAKPYAGLRLFVLAPNLIHNGSIILFMLIYIRFGTCEMRFF